MRKSQLRRDAYRPRFITNFPNAPRRPPFVLKDKLVDAPAACSSRAIELMRKSHLRRDAYRPRFVGLLLSFHQFDDAVHGARRPTVLQPAGREAVIPKRCGTRLKQAFGGLFRQGRQSRRAKHFDVAERRHHSFSEIFSPLNAGTITIILITHNSSKLTEAIATKKKHNV